MAKITVEELRYCIQKDFQELCELVMDNSSEYRVRSKGGLTLITAETLDELLEKIAHLGQSGMLHTVCYLLRYSEL